MEFEKLLSYIPADAENRYLLDILKTIPPDIARVLSVSTAETGTVLAYAGNEFNTVYLLLSGVIHLSFTLNSEFIYVFASIKAINILGETESFTHHPIYKASVVCHTKCQYIAMSKDLFLNWMKSDPSALYRMTEHIAGKYSNQVRQDRILLSASGENRFIYLLIKYYHIHSEDGVCKISTPKENLADEICVSVKTISRCIAKLKEERLISTRGHDLVLTQSQFEELDRRYRSL